ADALTSILFDDFLRERDNAAKMLSAKNKYSKGSVIIPGTGKAYYDGYSVNQQDVLLYAFYKAYTGRDIESYSTQSIFPKLPLPGWTLNFDGLGQLPVIQKHFRGISVRHGYRSTYSISSFNNDLLFNSDSVLQNRRYQVSVISGSTELNPNFISYYNINTVVFSENFEPLIRFDFQFKDPKWTFNTEMKRNKTIALNPKSIQIIETRGQEFVVGFGYKHPKLKIGKLMVLGRPLESPLTTRLDLSYRKNITVIRDISTANSMPSAGTNIWSVRSSADYQITDMITLRLFYDWTSNTPQTSAAFPTANANGGFSLRINFQ
ncbi:MAG: cell surface protein SprA, partial [Bacteroidia bacterium]